MKLFPLTLLLSFLSFPLFAEPVVETVAGTGHPELNIQAGPTSEFNIADPFGVEFGPDGRLYVTEVGNHRIIAVDLAKGLTETVIGTGKKGYSGDGGDPKLGTFKGPKGIVTDSKEENIYVVDTENQALRRINLVNNRLSSHAGYGPKGKGYIGDKTPAYKAKFGRPHGICIGPDGLVYTGDTLNHRVRRVVLE